MGSSADVPAEGTKQVYSLAPSLWPMEQFSTHRQSPLSRSRVTATVWGSGTNVSRQTCGSQLHTRLGSRPQRSRTGRLSRSSTRSPDANPRENNKETAGGPGRVLIVSVQEQSTKPKAPWQTRKRSVRPPVTFQRFISMTITSYFTRVHSHVLRIWPRKTPRSDQDLRIQRNT